MSADPQALTSQLAAVVATLEEGLQTFRELLHDVEIGNTTGEQAARMLKLESTKGSLLAILLREARLHEQIAAAILAYRKALMRRAAAGTGN